MTHKWQIVLLSAAVSYGSGLVAMDKKDNNAIGIAALNRSLELKRSQEKPTETRDLLSCSTELRRTQSQPVEINVKIVTQSNPYYYDSPCGYGRSLSSDPYFNNQPMYMRMAPVTYYPGQ